MVVNRKDKLGIVPDEECFDKDLFEKGILDLVKKSGGAMSLYAKAGGSSNIAQLIVKPFYEALLKAEMEDHLRYGKHEQGISESSNARNGKALSCRVCRWSQGSN